MKPSIAENKGEMTMFSSISDVRTANAEAGQHFFDRSTMRFFASRVESALYAGRYFITSEKTGFSDNGTRKFTVREAHADGRVTTYGETFNKFMFIEDARDLCRELVKAAKSNS
jgi:hypothetical protein